MNQKPAVKTVKPKALIFIGFRHKTGNIKTAREEGYKVVLLTKKSRDEAVGLFDEIIEGDLLDSDFLQTIIPHLKKTYSIKGIISNYEHYVVVRSYLAERFGIPSSTVYSAACTRNKAMQRHALKPMKENIEYQVVRTLKEANEALNELGGDVFIKSIAGVKSAHVFHVRSIPEMKSAFNILKKDAGQIDEDLYHDYRYCDFEFEYPDPKHTFLVEKAVQGQQVTVASLASNYTIWNAPSVCDIYPASHLGFDDSFLAFRILPSRYSSAVIKKIKKVSDGAIKILGMRYSPAHTELMVTDEGEVKIIETASRMGGYRDTMYQDAYGFNLNQLLVKSVIGKEIKVRKKALHHVSMMEIFPRKEGVFKGVMNQELLEQDPNIKRLEFLAKPGDKVGPAQLGYRPCVRFLITAKTYKAVYNKSMEYQQKLQIIL